VCLSFACFALTSEILTRYFATVGQKQPTPTPGFGDRVFYETLLRQRPDSAMAQQWCVDFGVLPHDEAERICKIVLKRKGKGKASPATAASPARKKKKARMVKEEDDPDLQGAGAETVGRAIL
jgi:hypothetical protein